MKEEYEINDETLAIISSGYKLSKILESDNTYFISQNVQKIIDESCKYFGSSYIGRLEGTKKITGICSKSPIIIEESMELIFFPTHSPRNEKCSWINFNQLKKIENDAGKTKLIFNNNRIMNLDVSYYSLKNQYLRASLLQSLLHKRKIIENRH